MRHPSFVLWCAVPSLRYSACLHPFDVRLSQTCALAIGVWGEVTCITCKWKSHCVFQPLSFASAMRMARTVQGAAPSAWIPACGGDEEWSWAAGEPCWCVPRVRHRLCREVTESLGLWHQDLVDADYANPLYIIWRLPVILKQRHRCDGT